MRRGSSYACLGKGAHVQRVSVSCGSGARFVGLTVSDLSGRSGLYLFFSIKYGNSCMFLENSVSSEIRKLLPISSLLSFLWGQG